MMARLKVLYLVAVSLAVFLVHDPRFVPVALLVHLVPAPLLGVRLRQVGRMVWRLRYFFLFLVVLEGLFPPRSHFFTTWCIEQLRRITQGRSLSVDPATGRPVWSIGVATAFFQMAQVFTMVLVSAIVRSGRRGRGLVDGLRGLLVPASAAGVIDACFEQIETDQSVRKEKNATRVGADRSPPGRRPGIGALWRGDVRWIIDRIEGELGSELTAARRENGRDDDAKACHPHDNGDDHHVRDDHDARLMTRITAVLMTLRMLRLAPGTGLTPGYQNVIVVPLLCLAADRTHRRWGASVVGTATGVLSIMLGLGRNGVFILPAHVLPGVIVDVGWRIVGRGDPGLVGCMLLGAAAGFARFTGMLLVLLLLDNTELLAAVPFFSLGHITFGLLSGAVTRLLVRESRNRSTREPA